MSEPVLNQSVELPDFDAWTTDEALVSHVEALDGGWVAERASALGRVVGTAEVAELARLANANPPGLRTFDRFGRRIDEVEFHPSYHRLMAIGKEHEVHAIDWVREGTPGAVVGRCALLFLYAQAEAGVQCPLTMTHAAVPALRHAPELARIWNPRLLGAVHEPELAPIEAKAGATVGMAMTEKQGGSDVRSNTTRAVPAGDGTVRLQGHKWFCSAPMSDGFLTLAQGVDGLGCYLVPRIQPDGARNPFAIQRLKDKLGNRSNASSEIEYHDTLAFPVGDPARGVATILAMVEQTRLDICINAAALMRQTVRYAVHHATNREAFGRRLVEHPLMTNVLADLLVEVEASLALAFRVAHAFDRRAADEAQAGLARVLTPRASTSCPSSSSPWCSRRWSATGATATSRTGRSPGSTARRRSAASGRGRATCSASTCSARCTARPGPATRCRSSSPGCGATTRGSTERSTTSSRRSTAIRRRSSSGPGRSPSGSLAWCRPGS